jgi:hypothetical protein
MIGGADGLRFNYIYSLLINDLYNLYIYHSHLPPTGGSLMFCDYNYFMAGIQAQLQGWF